MSYIYKISVIALLTSMLQKQHSGFIFLLTVHLGPNHLNSQWMALLHVYFPKLLHMKTHDTTSIAFIPKQHNKWSWTNLLAVLSCIMTSQWFNVAPAFYEVPWLFQELSCTCIGLPRDISNQIYGDLADSLKVTCHVNGRKLGIKTQCKYIMKSMSV